MRYEIAEHLQDEEFKRSTGVERRTFQKMLEVFEKGQRDFGRPPRLSRADQLLMTLLYWREYRTEYHIGLTYGVSEATVCRTIQKVEKALMQSGQFRLPDKKTLQTSGAAFDIVALDLAEPPIENPQEDSARAMAAGRNGTFKKRKRLPKSEEIFLQS